MRQARLKRDHEFHSQTQNGPRAIRTRAARWTVGIDQEVVTLRGLYGNSGSWRDLHARRNQS
jgi:hypothetical protein